MISLSTLTEATRCLQGDDVTSASHIPTVLIYQRSSLGQDTEMRHQFLMLNLLRVVPIDTFTSEDLAAD